MYHSTAVLLPDGRVLVAGGERFATCGDPQQLTDLDYDVFSPHYLQGSPMRPVITSVTGPPQAVTVDPDGTFVLDSTIATMTFTVTCTNIGPLDMGTSWS